MANSRFAYVRKFEQDDSLLPNTWMVVRIDGRSFHRFSDVHGFEKPNDQAALNLMNKCAHHVMSDYGDVVLAYGESDEYSFILKPSTTLYRRRASKIQSSFVSLFSSCYVYYWPSVFPASRPLKYPPSFDARVVCYPTDGVINVIIWAVSSPEIASM